ncbi:serine hydrolase [Arenimonas composti]|uniref:Beta-lactamase-related domain-containing protein n=1 Tax=Arenimonas composti TR7-09 = DSM 18010 TaxID=1121013 RepID=A0A091BD13_9GAMM|nr:serine hydrolase [Arenimonas composti]KFN48724.1 hypothetical protein P873_13790 [Arenimonas composti TR7-09 = DSM 18010]
MTRAARPFDGLAIFFLLATTLGQAVATPPRPDPAADARIQRIASALPAVTDGERRLQLSLEQWMQALGVPGVGIAVIDDYRIAWIRSYGVGRTGPEESPVTSRTLFQAASIAKPVTALAVLREVDAGRMDLDAGIGDYLRSWTLPAPEPGAGAGGDVTLRRLLAHAGGITPGGFAGYGPDEALPTLVDVLAGTAPANNPPARVLTPPGTEVAYSGLGYTLLQLALEDELRRPFADIVHDTVLAPLGLHDSTFALPLPEGMRARAAHGHTGTGTPLEGGWRRHPELAAAGLWTTPTDLATLVIDIAKARRGDSGHLLAPATAHAALAPQNDGTGLGFVVRDGDAHGYFAHSGGNAGYFAHFEMLADTGDGIVVMTNADGGHALVPLLIAAVANEYDWPLCDRREVAGARAERVFARYDLLANRRVAIELAPEALAHYVGRYRLTPALVFDITLVDGQLHLRLGDQPRFPLFAETPSKFFLEAVDAQISFVADASGRVTGLVLHQGGRDQPAPRIDD